MDELLIFKKNAILGNISGEPLCQEYKDALRGCGNDREKLMKLALRRQSIPFVMHACKNNMGLTKEFLLTNYGDLLNGNYTGIDVDGVQGGYTTQLFVGYDSNIYEVADTMAFIGSNVDMDIRSTLCPTLYVGCNTMLHLFLDGYNTISVYLFDNSKVVIEDADVSCNVVVRKYSKESSVEKGKYCLCGVREYNKDLRI